MEKKHSFFCIFENEDTSAKLLRKSCEERSIEFIHINPVDFDYTSKIHFEKGDLLYRIKTGQGAKNVERFLVNDKVTTFFVNFEVGNAIYENMFFHDKYGIPTPKTVFNIPTDRDLLKKYVEYCGGFPVIIKAMGGSHGVGVMKIDSLSSLLSVSDYLLSKKFGNGNGDIVMKEFINVTRSARLIALGGKVIDSIEYQAPSGDFRSNEGGIPNVEKKIFSDEINETAVRATQVLGLEFGGVDILIDEKGNHYVAEVNFPAFFPRAQMLSGVDISGMMVDYLVQKSEKEQV